MQGIESKLYRFFMRPLLGAIFNSTWLVTSREIVPNIDNEVFEFLVLLKNPGREWWESLVTLAKSAGMGTPVFNKRRRQTHRI